MEMPRVRERLMDYFAATRIFIPQVVFPEFTKRDREILTLIARGDSNAAIAEQLRISLKTVRNHVSNIYNKLQLADRTQFVIQARDAGL